MARGTWDEGHMDNGWIRNDWVNSLHAQVKIYGWNIYRKEKTQCLYIVMWRETHIYILLVSPINSLVHLVDERRNQIERAFFLLIYAPPLYCFLLSWSLVWPFFLFLSQKKMRLTRYGTLRCQKRRAHPPHDFWS